MIKTVLLVGEKGSGKSALINFFVNFVLGVRFEDKYRFDLTCKEEAGCQVIIIMSMFVPLFVKQKVERPFIIFVLVIFIFFSRLKLFSVT